METEKNDFMFCKLDSVATEYSRDLIKGAELRILSNKIIFPGYKGRPRFHNALIIWRAGKKSNKYSVIEMKP